MRSFNANSNKININNNLFTQRSRLNVILIDLSLCLSLSLHLPASISNDRHCAYRPPIRECFTKVNFYIIQFAYIDM